VRRACGGHPEDFFGSRPIGRTASVPVVRAPATSPFPRPHEIEPLAEGPVPDAPVQVTVSDRIPPQGYELTLDRDGIRLVHRDAAGRRYAEATLDQLRAADDDPGAPHGELPGVRIRDWPDVAVRGYMLDISRDRVPTRATLTRIVELMALARLNQLQLYTEHTFAYRDHEAVWRDASPLTPDDVAWLDELCRAAGIELVPNQNCFGHMERWLRHDAYRPRAETPDGFELVPGVHRSPAVLAPTAQNAAFVHGLLAELLPCFTSRQVNVGCDETFELGLGASRDAVERRGRARVWFDHMCRVVEPLLEQGYEVQVWADILRQAPELIAELPDGMIPVAWTYEAPPRDGGEPAGSAETAATGTAATDAAADTVGMATALRRAGIDPDAHRGFAGNVAPLVEAGARFWVAPGTSAWSSLVGRIDNALGNLLDAAEVGRAHGAGGYLITDWGDNGHLQPPSVSFGPLLYGGAVSWGLDANRDVDVAGVLNRWAFADPTRRLGGILDSAGRLWRRTGQWAANCSPLEAALVTGRAYMVQGRPDPEQLTTTVGALDDALASLDRAQPGCEDGPAVVAELTTAVRLARHGAWRLLARSDDGGSGRSGDAPGRAPSLAARRDDLAELVERQRSSWRARSRPGGLTDSIARLEATLAGYDAALGPAGEPPTGPSGTARATETT
jgi:hexosaminidase